jgi:hypothetical protein
MMKKLFLLGLLVTAVFFSCRKSDIEAVKTVSLTVQVGYNAEDSALGLSKENIPVKITNLVSGQDYTAITNANGVAIFANIAPSNYTIVATSNLTAEQYQTTTGVVTGSNVAFNATETQAINLNSNVRLQLQSGRVGDLVFKQIYYAGSNTSTGAVFRDQFVEIYNNSNQTIYLDSLYFGKTFCNGSALSTGATSYDWTKSIGIPTNINANKDYLYWHYLFMIPGTGKQHPLAPGKSIVIAQTAQNHTQPYNLNPDDKGVVVIQGITNPALTVDLSNADFETYAVEYKRAEYTPPTNNPTQTFTAYKWDVENPLVPNVNVIYISSGSDWAMDATGREDFVMFKANTSASTWIKYPDPTAAVINSNTNYGLQVPFTGVIDAVEIITPLETNRRPKRLPVSLDAAGTFVTGGQYSSQSLIRKTAKTVEGRRILQDTNNSANDFETKTKADPSKTDASFLK